MPAPKVLALVTSCKDCSNHQYQECRLAGAPVIDSSVVAPFCPLPDYPSLVIAGMERTIKDLREPNKPALALALLSHIATKLKLNLEADGRGVIIRFRDGNEDREVYVGFDYITDISLSSSAVSFLSPDRRRFKLRPDAQPPILEEAEEREVPGLEGKDLWRQHHL